MILSGVYQIVNQINGKRYIGSSVDIEKRFGVHKSRLCRNVHSNKHLQNSWNKYGKSNFIFEIVFLCDRDKTIENEQTFIDKLNPKYNIAKNARASFLGRHRTDKTKRKISDSLKGDNAYWYGKKLSKEIRQKLSDSHKGQIAWNKGKSLSEEHKRKLSENHADFTGENHPRYGKHCSEEMRRKISKAISGVNHPNYGKKPGNWINFVEDEINKMKELRKSGISYEAIGKIFNVSRNTIRNRIKEVITEENITH